MGTIVIKKNDEEGLRKVASGYVDQLIEKANRESETRISIELRQKAKRDKERELMAYREQEDLCYKWI